ncbi:MAG: PQQ-binding-like beta-propeller repeat protein [Pseudomonadota bacterium]
MFRVSLIVGILIWAQLSLANESCTQKPGINKFFQTGWGVDLAGQRFQADTTITSATARELSLKWSYGFSTDRPRVFPLVSEDTIFIGDGGLGLVALDKHTGCTRWQNKDIPDAATAISHGTIDGQAVLVLSGRESGVIAVDAISGETLWQRTITDDNPVAMYSGSPLVYEQQVFVPLSSMEIGLSVIPFYGCCTTSGGMAALDLATGQTNWYLRTIPEQPEVTGSHYFFVQTHGPSGAPVWGAPTLDKKRRLLYYGTGQNYSHPATTTSDAIFAVDIDTGKARWISQFTEGDAFNMACTTSGVNCPDPMGPDVDFGAPPVLVQLNSGKDLVLAGQKSGDVWAIDPDTGDTVWHHKIGRGGALGGVHWGIAYDPQHERVLIPISDVEAMPGEGEAEPGMFALDAATGERSWSVPRVSRCEGRQCWSGLSSGISTGPGIVVTGGLDGMIEIYATDNGDLLWADDTLRDYETVNEVVAYGGAIDAHGPTIADNQLIVISGYGGFGQRPGNALLVYEVTKETTR